MPTQKRKVTSATAQLARTLRTICLRSTPRPFSQVPGRQSKRSLHAVYEQLERKMVPHVGGATLSQRWIVLLPIDKLLQGGGQSRRVTRLDQKPLELAGQHLGTPAGPGDECGAAGSQRLDDHARARLVPE